MKCLIFSDLHLDKWPQWETDEHGQNVRLLEQLDLLRDIIKYGNEKTSTIFFLGDWFNRRLTISTEVLRLSYDVLCKCEVPFYFLVGNHDSRTQKAEDTHLEMLNELEQFYIIKDVTTIVLDNNVNMTMVPYGKEIPKNNNSGYNILSIHEGIKGAKIGPQNLKLNFVWNKSNLEKLGYDLILAGHIHKPQKIGKIQIVGSPMQLNFGESGEDKFLYVFCTEKKKLRKIKIPSPEFKIHIIEDYEQFRMLNLKDNNYHKLNIISDKISLQDLIPLSSKKIIINFCSKKQKEEKDILVTPSNTTEEIVSYFNSLDTDLDKKKLIELAMELVKYEI